MDYLKGSFFACLGAALIALSAAGLRTSEPVACAKPDDKSVAASLLLIF
ncbi:hypothetical protein [Hyphococcus sp.]|jgi:hypothetical protein